MQPKIGIVTVLYNSETVLDDFFDSLDKQTYRNFVLYIVDNKSPDSSLQKSLDLIPQVHFESVLLAEEENWGVAKGNNIGIKRALQDGCDYILLSNNDVVLDPNAVLNLYNGLIACGATMAIPKIYYHNTDLIWAAGGRYIYWNLTTPHIGNLQKDCGQFQVSKSVLYAPTCFMLIEKDVFARVGYMDEKYFVYYDDTDFVWRSLKRGIEQLYYIPSSELWHKESTCTGGGRSDFKLYYASRNVIYFARKNLSLSHKLTVFLFYFIHYVFRKPFQLSRKQMLLVWKAHRDGFQI